MTHADSDSDADRDAATGGTYTLLIAVPAPVTVEVGALGTRDVSTGAYAYTGSVLGAGGFSRVDRHRRVARGDHDVRHWHIDYLLGHPETDLDRVIRSGGVDVECAVADRLPTGPVGGFGASDCDCESHLAAGTAVDGLASRVRDAHETAIARREGDRADAAVEVISVGGDRERASR